MPNEKLPTRRILLTGGHITPALAAIEVLKNQRCWDIYFVGRTTTSEQTASPSVESELVGRHQIPFYPLQLAKFDRTRPLALINEPHRIFRSLSNTWELVGKIKPDIVLSFGGYIGLWVSLISRLRRIPIVIHEQTTSPGLANFISSFFASKIAVSWPNTPRFPAHKTILTGNPVRFELTLKPKQGKYPLNPQLPTVTILGGNQGSHAINELVIPLLPWLHRNANVFFQTGLLNPEDQLQAEKSIRHSKTNGKAEGKIYIRKYFYPGEYSEAIWAADVVVSRSGANTITELALLGKIAILIPLPTSASGEQTTNAKLLEPYGSQILSQHSLTPIILKAHILHLLTHLPTLKNRAQHSRDLIIPDAASKLVSLITTFFVSSQNASGR